METKECKHMIGVGFVDYEGGMEVYVDDKLGFDWYDDYNKFKFCPLCGKEIKHEITN